MIDTATLITYLIVVSGFAFIPGPATLLIAARASTSGMKVALSTSLGIAVGDFAHTVFAVFGISAIIMASVTAFTIVKLLGAAYLIYIGLKAIFGKSKLQIGGEKIEIGLRAAFHQGVISEILNPKTALFFLAFLPQFIKPENGSVAMQVFILSLILIVICALSNLVYAYTAGGLGNYLRKNPHVVKWQNRFLGGVFCSLGLSIALQQR
ncbi:LysE family translocator [Lentilitoribacter sp. Alg239-R112]|uniref:LysE family translocator n=1 Tax=Lentilitoribacter sp. Alg239-R112 TaxID=2305987 RepID=UPI0013A6FBFD|nr:LysE family translocator [Lentilitoribacter sp. Alg239-R112]